MSRQWNYGCMFPGSLHCTWIETNGNNWCVWAIRSQQFSHFIIIPIDASQLFITEHPVGEAGYSVTSFLQCLTQGQGKERKKKNKNQFWFQKYRLCCVVLAQNKNQFLVSKVQIVCLQFQIMGACFQVPCATPGQRLMETYLGKH